MLAEIKTGIEATRIAFDMAKSIVDMDNRAKINEAVIGIQHQVLSAQAGLMAAQQVEAELRATIDEMDRRIAVLTAWAEDKNNFAMVSQETARFMAPKHLAEGEEPYWLCISCFDRGVRSVVQGGARSSNGHERAWSCPNCNMKATTHAFASPQRQKVQRQQA